MFEIKNPSKVHFVKVGRGRLALYHRPRREMFASLRRKGCTHIVTLLKDTEDANFYGELARQAGMEWIWLPVPNGKYPKKETHERLINAMPELSRLLDEGNTLLVHCSAGIHRTGTVAYGLLRWRGMGGERAMQIIHRSRKETAEGMMDKRKKWGDDNARPIIESQDATWLTSVKEFVNRSRTRLFKPRSTPTPNAD
jgi:protein-tyrosine phosphatase